MRKGKGIIAHLMGQVSDALDAPESPIEPPVDPIAPIEEPEVADVPLSEFHPAAILVCFSCYFEMRYKELAPHIPNIALYDQQVFHADPDNRNREIVLTIKHGPHGEAKIVAVHRIPLAVFDRIYLEVPDRETEAVGASR